MSKCASDNGLDWDKIASCHDDEDMSWDLQVAAAAATPEDHTYVPWVVLDGDALDLNTCDDFLQAVCDAYKGDTPDACKKSKMLCMKD